METMFQRFFGVTPAITHHDCFYLLNDLVLFSNVSRSSCKYCLVSYLHIY